MSSNVDMNEVDTHLAEIARMYANDSLAVRMKVLFTGIKAPRQSKAYKLAMIELQRLSAPVAAIMLPMLAVGLLIVMSSGVSIEDRIIETQVLEAEELKDLDKIEEFQKPEEQIQDIDVDIPIDSPDVDVQADAPDQPMSPQPQAFDAVMMVKSPVILKNIYGSTRNTGTRGAQLVRFGGDKQTEEAVLRALRWLKKNQNKDGSWSNAKVAMTGLAVLTFLSHGEKPGESVEFGPTVQAALEFLMRVQNKTTGRLPGNYDHPIASYALCEAYGMTLNPNVKVAAEKSLELIIKGQHPTGGWTYNMDPNPDKETGKYRDDTSYMGWCAQALKAAYLARLHVDGLDKAMKLSIKGFKANAHPAGGFGYTSPGRGGLTSVGTLCMQLLGASNEPEVKKSLELIGTWKPTFSCYTRIAEEIKKVRKEDLKENDNPLGYAKRKLAAQINPDERMFFTASAQYYFYYATQCKFHEGGKHWEGWNKIMKSNYVKAQQIENNAIKDAKGIDRDIGWWTNVDAHSDRPVMDTCLAALQLMVYYRYLPTTSKEAVQVEEELTATSVDAEDIKVDTGNL
ncbi:MAG: terpene cyclase/mutase family protein [Kiritimatiellae bacterium]|nr:terpene cyclase/mutase family protein [Kiritimatiellia bacterium]